MGGAASETGHTVSLEDLTFVGSGLDRPECVRCNDRNEIYTSDARGGIHMISPVAGNRFLRIRNAPRAFKPNGISLCKDGSFLMADILEGGVFRISADGTMREYLREVDGVSLPPTNYVMEDQWGRTWITVSTRLQPRNKAYRPDYGDGFIILVDNRGARIVADGLRYTNEVAMDADGKHLYASETAGKRVSRFSVHADGSLRQRETVAQFGHGTFPDGLALDEEGGVWVTSIISNRVIHVGRDGSQRTVLEDMDEERVSAFEALFAVGTVERHDIENIKSKRLRNISSIAFGGPDRKTVYLGCLLGDSIASFAAPVAGLTMPHWTYRMPAFAASA